MRICKQCHESKEDSMFGMMSYGKGRTDKKFRSICKSCSVSNLKSKYPTSREQNLIYQYRRMDGLKGRTCNLTADWVKSNITNKPCSYCGTTDNIGCDRLDNTKGHTIDNVIPSCKLCNSIRGNRFTHDQMVRLGTFIKDSILGNPFPVGT
jgi:hypothetical protein